MRVVRLGGEPSSIGADVRAAVAAWGSGGGVLGGVALCGVRPPGAPRPLDAVLVLPKGVVAVLGVDLPGAAMQVDAPLRTPWTVDGWPLLRTAGGVNPAQDALESAAALARLLQARDAEPLPVTAIVAVGPYAERITQPTGDLHRGVRVLHPSPTSVLAAVRELATYERSCGVEAARRVLAAIDPRARASVAELTAEGFPDAVAPDMASASTMLLPKIPAEAPQGPARSGALGRLARVPARTRVVAGVAAAVVVLVAVVLALLLGGAAEPAAGGAAQEVDGTAFARASSAQDADCTEAATGEVREFFARQPCAGLTRQVFTARSGGRAAVISVADVRMPAESAAAGLRELLGTPGSGAVRAPEAEGVGWDGAARAVAQDGPRVRIVRAAWAGRESAPEDVALRVLAERGLLLTG